jgi:putative FmdB family regulatory protein
VPLYVYKCNDCEGTFEIRHGMSESQDSCILCESESIFKVPSILSSNFRADIDKRPSKVGKIVDDYIQQTKKDVKDQKRKLKSEEI